MEHTATSSSDEELPRTPDSDWYQALLRERGNPYGTAEVSESGVDISQLRHNLRLTPTERVERMVKAARFFASIRGTARKSRAPRRDRVTSNDE